MTVRLKLFTLLLALLGTNALVAQCDSIITTVDEFDSSYTMIVLPHVNIGYMIPSNYQTLDGYKMIEEGKIFFSYGMKDTVGTLFLGLVLAERNFRIMESEKKDKVLLLTESGRIEGVLNFSDKGEFDKGTNMRIYQHICVLPRDYLFSLVVDPIVKIRVYYEGGHKRTIELTPPQQEALTQALICLGKAVEAFPLKP